MEEDEEQVAPTSSRARSKSSATSVRSPNYPVCDVKEAFERAKKAYSTMRTGTCRPDVVAVAMGYKSLSGASRMMISAVKKFGLLEENKDGLRLTEDAKAIILLPQDDPRYIEAAKRCSLKPVVFAELYKSYGFDPPQEQSLKFLLVSKGFVEEAAADVIRNYKRTLEFLRHVAPDMDRNGSTEADEDPSSEMSSDADEKGNHAVPSAAPAPSHFTAALAYEATAELHLTLPGGCKAHVIFEGNVTQEAVERLRVYLEFFAEDQPTMNAVRVGKEAEIDGKEDM